jgi:hypothetical protein
MASVYEQRRRLEKALTSALPKSYLMVSGPDHPLVLRSADLLVGGEGFLNAIFIPTAAERRRPSDLKGRLLLNRLALPPHTRCFLVWEEKTQDLQRLFGRHFLESVEYSEIERLRRVVLNPRSTGRPKHVPPETVHFAAVQFAQALQVSRVMAILLQREARSNTKVRHERGSIFDLGEAGFGGGPEGWARVEHVLSREQVPISVALGRIRSDLLLEAIYEQAARLYDLRDGIPYYTAELSGILVVDHFPLMSRDPEKLIRAAAFAGLSLILENQRQRFELPLLRRLRAFAENRG